MALINHNLQLNVENAQGGLLPGKTFKPPNANQEFKKRTFSDVTNTLKSNQIGKPKLTPKGLTKGTLPFSVYNKESKSCQSSKNQSEKNVISVNKVSVSNMQDLDDDNITTCTCSDSVEDDFAGDILFQNIRLSKHAIENLALNWKSTPVCSAADLRKIEMPEVPIATDDGKVWLRSFVDNEFDCDIMDVPPVHSDFVDISSDHGFGL